MRTLDFVELFLHVEVVCSELIEISVYESFVFVEAFHQHLDAYYAVLVFATQQRRPFFFRFFVFFQMAVLFSNDLSLNLQLVHEDIFLDEFFVYVDSFVMHFGTLRTHPSTALAV